VLRANQDGLFVMNRDLIVAAYQRLTGRLSPGPAARFRGERRGASPATVAARQATHPAAPPAKAGAGGAGHPADRWTPGHLLAA